MTPANTRVEQWGGRQVRRCRACRAASWQRGSRPSLYEITADRRVQRALPVAMQVVGAVRDMDRDAVAELVEGADWPALLIALAAMVPDDQSPAQLLAWREERSAA